MVQWGEDRPQLREALETHLLTSLHPPPPHYGSFWALLLFFPIFHYLKYNFNTIVVMKHM